MPGNSRHVPARPQGPGRRPAARRPGRAPSGRDAAGDRSAGARDAAPDRDGAASRAGAGHGVPDTERVAGAVEPVVHALGMDLESVRIKTAGRRKLLRVVVDSDRGVSLDDAAAASRELSAALDASGVMGEMPYTLEVSSPGVDRPLTQPRHWRRAAGRLVRVSVASSGAIKGRIVTADETGVTLDVDGDRRAFGYAELGPGEVLIEFGHAEAIQPGPAMPRERERERGPGAKPDGH